MRKLSKMAKINIFKTLVVNQRPRALGDSLPTAESSDNSKLPGILNSPHPPLLLQGSLENSHSNDKNPQSESQQKKQNEVGVPSKSLSRATVIMSPAWWFLG